MTFFIYFLPAFITQMNCAFLPTAEAGQERILQATAAPTITIYARNAASSGVLNNSVTTDAALRLYFDASAETNTNIANEHFHVENGELTQWTLTSVANRYTAVLTATTLGVAAVVNLLAGKYTAVGESELNSGAANLFKWMRVAPGTECKDDNMYCSFWKGAGKCGPNNLWNAWMHINCRKSCEVCIVNDGCYYPYYQDSYAGELSVTKSGKQCLTWAEINGDSMYSNANNFPDASMEEASNKCRNPNRSNGMSSQEKPWCFYQIAGQDKPLSEDCDVPECGTSQC